MVQTVDIRPKLLPNLQPQQIHRAPRHQFMTVVKRRGVSSTPSSISAGAQGAPAVTTVTRLITDTIHRNKSFLTKHTMLSTRRKSVGRILGVFIRG